MRSVKLLLRLHHDHDHHNHDNHRRVQRSMQSEVGRSGVAIVSRLSGIVQLSRRIVGSGHGGE